MAPSAADTLVVRDVRAVESATGIMLSARIETPGIALPSTVWFEYPPGLAPFVVPNGDAFFPVALLAAMRYDRRLVIESDVSSALLTASSRVMEHYQAAGEPGFQRIEVVADAVPRRDRGQMAGVFFSCGVDSFYTLLGNVARYPEEDSRSISHLVLVHGFDIALEQEPFFEPCVVRWRLWPRPWGRPSSPSGQTSETSCEAWIGRTMQWGQP